MQRPALALVLAVVLAGSSGGYTGAAQSPAGETPHPGPALTARPFADSTANAKPLRRIDDAASRAPTTGNSASRLDRRHATQLAKGFRPAVAATRRLSRYFVVLKAPSLAERITAHGGLSPVAQERARTEAKIAQAGAMAQARALGGKVLFAYGTLINGFSAQLSPAAAATLSKRPDVASVQPVSIVLLDNASSVPFIGATRVWQKFGVRGQGMTLALVDTGIDYTHKDFGGRGTVAAYDANNPNFVEPGTFPTKKVIGGFDFVGSNYNVLDADTSNDTPRPDFDPLDRDGHGTHTGGTCCGIGVGGSVGAGVAPRVKILAYKVWDVGNSTDDVLVAAYERAVDPNQDGDTSDHADVLSFSGGVDFGTLNSVEAVAAQRVVDLGTVFVASAGNAGNQPSAGSAYVLGTPAAARGVVAVAASIDQALANRLKVNAPSGISFPDDGVATHQSWSGVIGSDITDTVIDARQFDPPADPGGAPTPTDRMLCDSTPAGSFGGHVALVFKGSTGGGDCTGTEKVFRAQQMGASAVIIWDGFPGFSFDLAPGDFTDQVTIPAVMLSQADSDALAAAISPSPPAWNSVQASVTITAAESPVPVFSDSMAAFSSEGPARLTTDLKPDITAPGVDIVSAGVGSGTGSSKLSGTSMAAPHVSGTAVLLRQLHPGWSPARIKALLMNQAVRKLKNSDLSSPVAATVMGSGRVDAFASATAVSVAAPGSLSYGFRPGGLGQSVTRSFKVHNFDRATHTYGVRGTVRYSDFNPSVASIKVSLNRKGFAARRRFSLAPGATRRVWVRLSLHPTVISEAAQLFGWYGFNPGVDGSVAIRQNGPHRDTLRVAWHVAPIATARNSLSQASLDLTSGSRNLTLSEPSAAGTSYADLYLLGTTDPVESTGEEDIVAVGARSFTGIAIDGAPKGVPTGTDALVGLTWTQFISNADTPTEPVEFVVQSAGVRNTAQTQEIDIKIDSGADGVFADPGLQADYLVVKPAGGNDVCVFNLSQPSPFDSCAAVYFGDYSVYNTNVAGLPVDARAIGLTTAHPLLSYQVTSCTGRFSGDVPGQLCDVAGSFDSASGTWSLRFNATHPALAIDHLVCKGFWGAAACDTGHPIHVATGSAGPGEDPSILAIFPNNRPSRQPTVISTRT
jgi:minor extracellular serine protease Vpr